GMSAPVDVAVPHVEGDGDDPGVVLPALAGLGVEAVPEVTEQLAVAFAVVGHYRSRAGEGVNPLSPRILFADLRHPLHPNVGYEERQARGPAGQVDRRMQFAG